MEFKISINSVNIVAEMFIELYTEFIELGQLPRGSVALDQGVMGSQASMHCNTALINKKMMQAVQQNIEVSGDEI